MYGQRNRFLKKDVDASGGIRTRIPQQQATADLHISAAPGIILNEFFFLLCSFKRLVCLNSTNTFNDSLSSSDRAVIFRKVLKIQLQGGCHEVV
jgi:hypothetical protein